MRSALGGGGRYDRLAEEMGGDPAPGIGFGIGIERLLIACDGEGVLPAPESRVDAFVVDAVGGERGGADTALVILDDLREAGLRADRAYGGRSVKAQWKVADRSGAAFTVITLLTGAIWGKPMWGTWWDWDPRLTTELILLFLYLGVIGLYNAIDDRRAAARAAGFLAIVGVVLLPVIRYSVVWWNSLHQGQTIRLMGESTMDASMVQPLIWMIVGTKLWFIGALLMRARADNLRRESGKAWVAQLATAADGPTP